MSGMTPDLSGRTIGNWELTRPLGEGAFGSVYAAQHRSIPGRLAAVKVLHPHLALHKDIKRRFITEASVASQAEHENIVQIFDGGVSEDGICYLAMELLNGCSLAQLIEKGPLRVARTVQVGLQVCSALEAAHTLAVVHRDLKPDNIFLAQRKNGTELVKVLDFGVAKLQSSDRQTQTGVLMGTPVYMAPEQWQTVPDIDGRADLYALGVILYECLAGKPPYDAPTTYALLMAHMNNPVPELPAHVRAPDSLKDLIRQLLAKEREARPRTATEVVTALRKIAEQVGSEDKDPPTAGPSGAAKPPGGDTSSVGSLVIPVAIILGAVVSAVGIARMIKYATRPKPPPVESSAPEPPPTPVPAPPVAPAVKPAAPATPAPAPTPPAPTPAVPEFPAELSIVEGGRFQMGWTPLGKRADGPAHLVAVGRFAIAKQEVSVAEYRDYATAVGLPPPLPWTGVRNFSFESSGRLPVTQVTRDQAAAYCKWRYPQWGGRLPREAEWEYAARGGPGPMGHYPWPKVSVLPFDSSLVNAGRRPALLMAVETLPEGANRYGMLHVLGNVAEWVADNAVAYPRSSVRPPPNTGVIRGGSAVDPMDSLSATGRAFISPLRKSPFVGFRCAATPPAPSAPANKPAAQVPDLRPADAAPAP